MKFPLLFEAAYSVPNANHMAWRLSLVSVPASRRAEAIYCAPFDHIGPHDAGWRFSRELGGVQERQIKREKSKRREFINLKDKDDAKYMLAGRGSQARGSKGLMQVLVPAVTYWLERHYEVVKAKSNNVNLACKEYHRLQQHGGD